jgi:hypothetical protein
MYGSVDIDIALNDGLAVQELVKERETDNRLLLHNNNNNNNNNKVLGLSRERGLFCKCSPRQLKNV